MTVKELCEKLEGFDRGSEVRVLTRDTWHGYEAVKIVRVEHEFDSDGYLYPVIFTEKQKGRD